MLCDMMRGMVWEEAQKQTDHSQPIIQNPVSYNNTNHFRQSEVMCDLNLQPPRSILYSETK